MRKCQAEARRPCRHFLDQKKVAKEGAALGFHLSITPVAPEVRASLSLPRESDKERPGSPPGPRARRQPSSGGCRSGPPAVRGGIRASTSPLVGLALPAPLGQGGGRQPSPPAVRGGIWADPAPLGRVWEMGPKRQPATAANPVAGQAAGPLGKSFASQNCPQLYQGESGGLEPAMKPMAGQAGAPLHFPFAPAGFQGACPLVSLWLLSSDQESNNSRTSGATGVI